MDHDLIKRRQRELSKQQAMYVAKRETGAPKEQSAIFAGYPAGQKAGDQVENSALVQGELAKARAELAKSTGITKEDVLDGLREAANMAQTMADPQAMVRAWSEIGKMLGHYAPEVKKVVHGLDQESRDAIRRLDDSELHKLAKGRVIDSTAREVKDE
jgi:D-alanyl-D-alanine dipeptidase